MRVVQDYVSLKKKGANWMACCPFHQEKTPSFSVSPSKEIFYCFSCQKGGSVFTFVMEMERVSFPEAIKIVAEKVNMPLPVMQDNERFESRRKEADEVVELNSWALEWWERQLAEGNAEAKSARDYIEGRGITDETRETFRLGYAPDSWDGLSSYLKGKGADAGQIERSGLVVKKDAGGFYDRFRGRVIFPVLDAQGRAVAFGGRVMQTGEPKYLNSPETAAYTKGRHLYGLHQTRDEIRRKKFIILVEGYLDVIVPYQFGVRNAVASLGTALTPEQAKLMGRFARRVVVNYDGDRAGVSAAKRAIETLLAEDFDIKVLVLPDNADPDSFIKAAGVEAYNERRGAALPHIQFVLDQAMRDRNLYNPPEKSEAVKEVIPFIRAVRDKIQKREYFDIAMDGLRIERTQRAELWQTIVKSPAASGNTVASKMQDTVTNDESATLTIAEQRLLELLIHDAELRRILLPRIERKDYEALPSANVFHALKELELGGLEITFDNLSARTTGDPIATNLIPLLMWSEPQRAEGEATDDVAEKAETCLSTLQGITADVQLKQIIQEIKAAQRANDYDRIVALETIRQELARQVKYLEQKRLQSGFN